jgi:hypothetical protein
MKKKKSVLLEKTYEKVHAFDVTMKNLRAAVVEDLETFNHGSAETNKIFPSESKRLFVQQIINTSVRTIFHNNTGLRAPARTVQRHHMRTSYLTVRDIKRNDTVRTKKSQKTKKRLP